MFFANSAPSPVAGSEFAIWYGKEEKEVLLCGMQQELLNFLVGAHLLSSRIRIHAAL
jgi:hypothetical protein